MAKSNLNEVDALGQAVWIDYLSRDLLETGELAKKMRDDAITGVTSNPTIFQKAISHGERYDEQLTELLERETDPREVFIALAARDITVACDLLPPTPSRGDGGLHPRARAARGGRRRPDGGFLRRELLRLARRHGSGQAPGRDRRP